MGGKSLYRMKQEWYWKAKEERAGALQAEREFNALKTRKKPLEDRILGWIEQKLAAMEPIEALTIGGLTIILQPLILDAEKFKTYLSLHVPSSSLLGQIRQAIGVADSKGALTNLIGNDPTAQMILSWLFALVLASIVVKMAPKMMSGASSIGEFFNIETLLTGLLTIA